MSGLDARLRHARHWARRVGRLALEAFRETSSSRKADDSVVTETDRAVERTLRNLIEGTYPSDGVLGEEHGTREANDSAWRWVLDPIDGTASFALGLSSWTVCVGIEEDERPAAGVLWTPYLREEHYGGRDRPARWDDRTVAPEPVGPDDWDRQTLLLIPSRTHLLYDVSFPGKCRNLGSTAYHMGAVIDGRAIAAVLGRIHHWDVAAALAIGRPLGLRLEGLDGESPDWEHLRAGGTARRALAFGPPSVLEALREHVQPR